MRKIAEYALSSRRRAILLALLFAVIPFFGWLAIALMALVTLRKGMAEGFIVLAWISLPSLVLALNGQSASILYDIVLGVLIVWVLAGVLRQTASWTFTIQVTVLMGMVIVLVAHGAIHHLDQRWATEINQYMQQINRALALKLTDQEILEGSAKMAQFATGVQVVILLIGNLTNLVFARWVQASLYNPSGLRKELYNIRLDFKTAFILLVTFVLMWIDIHLAKDCVPVVLLPFSLAGLSLVHSLLAKTKYDWSGLLIFYGLLILFFPYIMLLLIVATLADIRWDFRARVQYSV